MADTGRPTVMTPETIAKLEEAFLNGATDKEASFIADIAPATLYAYCKENPEFSERKEALKEMVKYRARQNIAGAINDGDKTLSQWYLERKAKDEFSAKSEVENTGNLTINVVSYHDSSQVPTQELPATDTQSS